MEISITKELNRFKEHIEKPDNSRIFFSGIFGIGKTHFLKEFFKSNSLYECVVLRPVNYSIGSNKDIIDYIKYDIIFELLGKNIAFEKTDFSKLQTTQYYVKENFIKTASILAKMSGSIGKPIANIIDGLHEINKNIVKHNKELQIDERKELTDFLNIIKEKDGSIYEENSITDLISALVRSLKVSENEDSSKKQTVLIIDDLDRLDPEHIFRILNVFACHFDLDVSEENKFGFNKVIVVGDSENIRNIFQTKYGIDTDFNGYIDKFYSSEIYKYDNKFVLSDFLSSYLSKLKTDRILYLSSSQTVHSILLYEIFRGLINYDLFNLRNVKTSRERYHHLEQVIFKAGNEFKRLSSHNVVMIPLFQLLVSIYGSETALKTTLNKLSNRNPSQIIDNTNILEPILCLIDYKKHKGKEGNYQYKNSNIKIHIHYSIQSSNSNQINLVIDKIFHIRMANQIPTSFPFAPLLYLTFQEFLNLEKMDY